MNNCATQASFSAIYVVMWVYFVVLAFGLSYEIGKARDAILAAIKERDGQKDVKA